MPDVRTSFLVAAALSLGIHAGLLALWATTPADPASTAPESLQVEFMSAPVEQREALPKAVRADAMPSPTIAVDQEHVPVTAPVPPSPSHEKTPASMPAPLAPTAEEWALASTYTLKNSKRYRYAWGQQVRSMMGTAVEGVRQGVVRFRIEIAPDGTLARADVLWSTSTLVEELALQAIRALPPLPPTPTGKPLVFEKTIAFVPFETGWPPIYKYDCLPDPPSFRNRFAWDGSSPQPTSQTHQESASTAGGAAQETECADTGPDSIEAEEKDMERQFKEWGTTRLNGAD